jgi:hypothetical protein
MVWDDIVQQELPPRIQCLVHQLDRSRRIS